MLRPEFVGIVDRLFVDALVFVEALDVGVLAEFRRRLELALLVQDGIDVRPLSLCGLRIDDRFISHDKNLDAEEFSFVPKIAARDRRSVFYTARGRM